MYYGEEIGMENNDPKRKEDVQDPIRGGAVGRRKRARRRTNADAVDRRANAGFSHGQALVAGAVEFQDAQRCDGERGSEFDFEFLSALLALRSSEAAFRDGKYIAVNQQDPNVFSYLRRCGGETILVAVNMSASGQSVKLERGKVAAPSATATVLVAVGAKASPEDAAKIGLEPYGVYVAKVDSRLR